MRVDKTIANACIVVSFLFLVWSVAINLWVQKIDALITRANDAVTVLLKNELATKEQNNAKLMVYRMHGLVAKQLVIALYRWYPWYMWEHWNDNYGVRTLEFASGKVRGVVL